MWNRWKAGQSLNEIGRALGKDHVVVHFVLARHGGIAPPARRRSRRVLTLAEREDISRGIASGCAMRVIARGLHRSASTISREITRHGGRTQYRANAADQQAWESAVRPKPCRLATHSELQQMVASKLMQDWSPQQVSGWLKMEYPNDESLRVSHETIYRSLFIQARGALKQELVRHLRSKRRIRRSRHSSVHGHSRGQIVDAISIRERPAEVEDRAVPGHWEGDLLRGAGNSHVVTLVERRSRFCMLVKAPGKDIVYGGGRSEPARGPTPGGVASLADLGPRTGDGPTQNLHDGDGYAGLLLRSAESLAARLKRKHKRPTAAIPAKERRPVQVLAIGAGRDRSATQYPATTNLGISNSGG